MTQAPQEVFDHLRKIRKELGEKKKELKNAYLENEAYKHVEGEMQTLRRRRKNITIDIDALHPDLTKKIEDLSIEYKDQKQLFDDLMLTKYVEGQEGATELQDDFKQPCLPVFQVKVVKKNS